MSGVRAAITSTAIIDSLKATAKPRAIADARAGRAMGSEMRHQVRQGDTPRVRAAGTSQGSTSSKAGRSRRIIQGRVIRQQASRVASSMWAGVQPSSWRHNQATSC